MISGLLGLIIIATAAAGVALVATLTLTNPTAIGPVGVTLWFGLLFIVITGGLTIALYSLKKLLLKQETPRRRLLECLRQGALVGGWTIIVLGLSSLGQASIRDALLLAILVGLIEFYAWTKKSGSDNY